MGPPCGIITFCRIPCHIIYEYGHGGLAVQNLFYYCREPSSILVRDTKFLGACACRVGHGASGPVFSDGTSYFSQN
jgi:hypothetical protein